MSDPVNWTDEVLRIGRVTHLHELVDPELFDYDVDDVDKPPVVTVEDGANVVSSLLTNGNHAPCIDLDVPAMLVPSSTPGHSHLYIDIEVPWKKYLRLLQVMADIGLVEDGFVKSADRRGTTLLRLPHILKRHETKNESVVPRHARTLARPGPHIL